MEFVISSLTGVMTLLEITNIRCPLIRFYINNKTFIQEDNILYDWSPIFYNI